MRLSVCHTHTNGLPACKPQLKPRNYFRFCAGAYRRHPLCSGPIRQFITLVAADRLRIAYEAVKAEAAVFGSLPPSPPTVRARAALGLMWFVNRLVWWQTAASKRFAKAVCEFVQVQMESQAEQHARMQERLQAIEMKLQEIQKSID